VSPLKVELVRPGPGAIGRHKETLAIEEEGFPPKTTDKVRDVVDRQPLGKGKIVRFDSAGAM
jgi:hypothetical protein